MKVLMHGMPQGLILGPFLFLVFLNYLLCLVKKSTVDIYTNNMTLSTSALFASPTTVKSILQKDLDQVLIWSSKTKAMLVTDHLLDKKLGDKSTEQVMSEKFLEVRIDTNLTFDDYIDELREKVAQRIGVLKSMKRNLPIKEQKLFYNSIIKSIMLYGSTVWGSCSNENIDKDIQFAEKSRAYMTLDADMKERSSVMFKKLNLLPNI